MDQKKPAILALIALLVALAVAINWSLWKGKVLPQKAGITKEVAVLPFENLSPDPDDADFAEGIQEEILARLATIHDFEGHFAQFHAALYAQTAEPSGHCEAAWRIEHT
jgi:Predicted integral membrane protein